MGVPIYALPGFEADDVIGALAKQAEAAGLETIIVSGDLDTLQLVTPNTKLFTTRMGFQNTVVYDEAQIAQRYGLRPDQMIDFKALKGDTTDNIPGVPGVGEKTAAKLIAENGSIEGVYEDLYALHTEAPRGSRGEQGPGLPQPRDVAGSSPTCRSRSTSRRHASATTTARACSSCSAISSSAASSRGCRRPMATSRRSAAPPARPGQLSLGLDPAPAVAPPVATTLVGARSADAVAAELRAAARASRCTPTSTSDATRSCSASASSAGDDAWYVPTTSGVPAPIASVLADETIAKIAHDAKTARRALRRAGAELRGVTMDTMLASYLVNASRRYHALEDLSAERLKLEVPVLPVADRKDPHRVPTPEERLARAGAGAVAAARLGAQFDADLDRLGMRELFARDRAAARRRPGRDGGGRHRGRPAVPAVARAGVRARGRAHRARGVRRRRARVPDQLAKAARLAALRGAEAAARPADRDRATRRMPRCSRSCAPRTRSSTRSSSTARSRSCDRPTPRGSARSSTRDTRRAPHDLRPGGRGDGAALEQEPEPAEHPDPHAARPPHPARLRRRAAPIWCCSRPTTRRSSCASSRTCRATPR